MIIEAYAGEATYHLKSGRVRHFKPHGRMILVDGNARRSFAGESRTERIGGGGYAARIFVGLNVGTETKFSVDDVIDETFKIRSAQKHGSDASFVAQRGLYQDKQGRKIDEPSVQIIIIDLAGLPKKQFVDDMERLAEDLQDKFEQETVILEIQKRGVVTDVYSVTT